MAEFVAFGSSKDLQRSTPDTTRAMVALHDAIVGAARELGDVHCDQSSAKVLKDAWSVYLMELGKRG